MLRYVERRTLKNDCLLSVGIILPRGGERRFLVFVVRTLRKHYRNLVHTMTKTLRATVGVRTTFALSVFTFLSVLAISAHPCRRIKSLSNAYLPLFCRKKIAAVSVLLENVQPRFFRFLVCYCYLFLHILSSLVKTLPEIFDSGGYQFSLDFRSSPA